MATRRRRTTRARAFRLRLRQLFRRQRADVQRYEDLLESPAETLMVAPANARLAFRSVGGNSATTAGTISGTSIGVPDLSPGEISAWQPVERGEVVTVASGFRGVIDLGLGRLGTVISGVAGAFTASLNFSDPGNGGYVALLFEDF